jgi:hypothetical protein
VVEQVKVASRDSDEHGSHLLYTVRLMRHPLVNRSSGSMRMCSVLYMGLEEFSFTLIFIYITKL